MFIELSSPAWVHTANSIIVDSAPGGHRPLDQANRLGLEIACSRLSSTPTIAIRYYYLAQKLTFILP